MAAQDGSTALDLAKAKGHQACVIALQAASGLSTGGPLIEPGVANEGLPYGTDEEATQQQLEKLAKEGMWYRFSCELAEALEKQELEKEARQAGRRKGIRARAVQQPLQLDALLAVVLRSDSGRGGPHHLQAVDDLLGAGASVNASVEMSPVRRA